MDDPYLNCLPARDIHVLKKSAGEVRPPARISIRKHCRATYYKRQFDTRRATQKCNAMSRDGSINPALRFFSLLRTKGAPGYAPVY